MHFRIPFLLALATRALADFGYDVYTSTTIPESVKNDPKDHEKCPRGDKTANMELLSESNKEDLKVYQDCKSVGKTSTGEKYKTFMGTAPDDGADWYFEVYQNDNCDGGDWQTVNPGKCVVLDSETPGNPEHVQSFRMVKSKA